jgi:phage gp45-like
MYQEITQMAKRALNRLNNILCRGVLNTITQANVPTANISLFNEETYEGVEFSHDFGFISYPPCDGNTELIVAFLRGERDNGTILKAFNRKYSLKQNSSINLLEGECAVYNKISGNYLLFKQDGSILLQHNIAGSFIKINADGSMVVSSTSKNITFDSPTCTFTGNVIVDGDVLDNATGSHINTNNIRAQRSIFNNHVHPGVTIGPGNTAVTTTDQ